ncbi:hypothetical protein [Alysiella filiformis]|uniref:hypothetical protein n=1 Tax=Alysiella filiformis TaxID=194196 RepID=UPI001178C820|nr:hypothetical protein [Alysiella filiformis]QMT32284.1 hypothetical protein H3L97_05490 [Alysiella filiformis]
MGTCHTFIPSPCGRGLGRGLWRFFPSPQPSPTGRGSGVAAPHFSGSLKQLCDKNFLYYGAALRKNNANYVRLC